MSSVRTTAKYRRLARIVSGLAILLALGAIVLAIFGRAAPYSGWGFRIFPALISLPFSILGLIILNRFPKHGMGWVFLGTGINASVQATLLEYMLYSLVLFPHSLSGGLFVAWVLNSFWILNIVALALMLILFPTGELPSRRWRPFVWTMAASFGLVALFLAFAPRFLDSSFGALENPYALQALRPIAGLTNFIAVSAILLATVPPTISLISRFRHAQGAERQQYKWFVFAAALFLAGSTIGGPSENPLLQSVFIATMLFIPVAVAVAILRYRLYDIDLIIRRTLVYAVLTAVLAAVYFGSVVALQSIITAVGGQQSAVVTVISTLVIAALFTPLRRRVQDFIDRRFYRQKYDAEQTLAAFAATARDEVDVERLAGALLGVVEETMQPASVSLMLTTPTARVFWQ